MVLLDRSCLLVPLLLAALGAPAFAQAPASPAGAETHAKDAHAALQVAERAAAGQDRRLAEARRAVAKVHRTLEAREEIYRKNLRRWALKQRYFDASERDVELRDKLGKRLDKLASAGPAKANERRALARKIDALHESILRLNRRFLDGAKALLATLKADRAALRSYRDTLRAGQKKVRARQRDAAKARKAAEQARSRAGATRAALDELLARRGPPILREIQVRQQGALVYRAHWTEDTRARDLIDAQRVELRREIVSFRSLRARILEDQRGFFRKINFLTKEMARVKTGIDANRTVLALSAGIWKGAMTVLDVATLVSTGGALHAALRVAWKKGGTKLLTAGGRALAANQSFVGGWARAKVLLARGPWKTGLRFFRRDVLFRLPERYAARLAAHMGLLRWPVAALAVYEQYQALLGSAAALKETADAYRGKAPDRTSMHWPVVERAIRRAQRTIDATQSELRREASAHASGQALAEELATEIDKRFGALFQALQDKDKSIWRSWWTLKIGKVFTSDAKLEMAKNQITHARLLAKWKLYTSTVETLAQQDSRLAARIATRRERIAKLREARSLALDRRLRVQRRAPLRVAANKTATIRLRFSRALAAAPKAELRPADGPAGPATDRIPVSFRGQGEVWAGTVSTTLLGRFFEHPGGARLHVAAKSADGLRLDANPETAATQASPGVWIGWETHRRQLRGEPSGGGDDTWHALGLRARDATSYCFLVDASGSMKDNGRMEAVKRSVRQFVERMKPADEVELWAFFGCGEVRRIVAFTTDKPLVIASAEALKPYQGTPLAEAIRIAGGSLLRHGRYHQKALVILTDGQETCQGNPQLEAARFRMRVRVVGFGEALALGAAPARPTAKRPPPKPAPRPASAPRIAVHPSDRRRFRVEMEGRTPVLIETRFWEDGVDGDGWAVVQERRFYTYYARLPGGSVRWGVNPAAFATRRLAAARTADGQAAMDRVRAVGAKLPGGSRENANADIVRRIESLPRGGSR